MFQRMTSKYYFKSDLFLFRNLIGLSFIGGVIGISPRIGLTYKLLLILSISLMVVYRASRRLLFFNNRVIAVKLFGFLQGEYSFEDVSEILIQDYHIPGEGIHIKINLKNRKKLFGKTKNFNEIKLLANKLKSKGLNVKLIGI